MTKQTIYLAGPMSGYVDYNFPAFNLVANFLRSHGYPVVNPADFGDGEPNWTSCLKRALVAMMNCDIVVTLPGWADSKGANLEVNVARELGITVLTIEELLRSVPLVTPNMATRVIKRARGERTVGETPGVTLEYEIPGLPTSDFAESFAEAVVTDE